MRRIGIALCLLLSTTPWSGGLPDVLAGLPGWVVQVLASAVLFASLVAWLLHSYWGED